MMIIDHHYRYCLKHTCCKVKDQFVTNNIKEYEGHTNTITVCTCTVFFLLYEVKRNKLFFVFTIRCCIYMLDIYVKETNKGLDQIMGFCSVKQYTLHRHPHHIVILLLLRYIWK